MYQNNTIKTVDFTKKSVYNYYMKTTLFLILLVSLVSCKKATDGQAPGTVDTPTTETPPTAPPTVPAIDPIGTTKESELSYLTNLFISDYSASWSNISIGFKPSSYMNSGGGGGSTTVGVCEVYSDGSKRVWMNQDWWTLSTTSMVSKKVLFYHEMGHCYFNRAHDTRLYAGTSRPYSIMYPNLDPVAAFYPTYTSYYNAELQNSALAGSMITSSKMSNNSVEYEEPVLVTMSNTMDSGDCEILE